MHNLSPNSIIFSPLSDYRKLWLMMKRKELEFARNRREFKQSEKNSNNNSSNPGLIMLNRNKCRYYYQSFTILIVIQ